ncbi:hypothetical protein LTR84_012613 [Exophiala bonariae]|uniref:Uncharacterized protein n=1 Tax=Exophiala bonariae TaxID=1690606 RepID=A0AAV9NIX1_9EURO|nr:hypothetical protein LTR84_012613 [Exophiala bonariae]
MAAYHRGDDGEEEGDDDMDESPGVESEICWDISDDGSEWEDIGHLLLTPDIDRFNADGENAEGDKSIEVGLERQEKGKGGRAPSTDAQERHRNGDDWEVISLVQEISKAATHSIDDHRQATYCSSRIASGRRVVVASKTADSEKRIRNGEPGK